MTPEQRKQAKALIKSVYKANRPKNGYPLNVGATRSVASGFRLEIDWVPAKAVKDTVTALKDHGFMVEVARTAQVECVGGAQGGHRVMYVRR